MKLSMKKIYSIAMAGLSVLLFAFTFIPQFKYSYDGWGGSSSYKYSFWSKDAVQEFARAFGIIKPILLIIVLVAIIAVYVLHVFGIFKEKWMSYANYATGFVTLTYLNMFFANIKYAYVGIWLSVFVAIGLCVVSVLWNFASDKALGGNGAPVTGYDPATGKPIYAKPTGFDPVTGKPIYK